MLKLTGLWQNENKNGKYLAGNLSNGIRILVFSNDYKEKDNQPDYLMFLAPVNGKNQSGEQEENKSSSKKKQKKKQTKKDESPF